jgi:hypothetical protein
VKRDELRGFLDERSIEYTTKPLQGGVQFKCSEGEVVDLYDTGRVAFQGNKTTDLARELLDWHLNGTKRFPEVTISSVGEYIERIKKDTNHWDLPAGCAPWFRGQFRADLPPLPGIFRPGTRFDERAMNLRFQTLAPMLGPCPSREVRDEWLYLMQHVGVPTRLLDWSQGALIGLYFAIQHATGEADPGVWVVHPLEMNKATIGYAMFPDAKHPAFIKRCDYAFENTEQAPNDFLYPIAIIPTQVHPRMRSQRGCFTMHGYDHSDFESIAAKTGLTKARYFLKYRVRSANVLEILRDLRVLGITHSTLFPDHDGLAVDLKRDFAILAPGT